MWLRPCFLSSYKTERMPVALKLAGRNKQSISHCHCTALLHEHGNILHLRTRFTPMIFAYRCVQRVNTFLSMQVKCGIPSTCPSIPPETTDTQCINSHTVQLSTSDEMETALHQHCRSVLLPRARKMVKGKEGTMSTAVRIYRGSKIRHLLSDDAVVPLAGRGGAEINIDRCHVGTSELSIWYTV